MAGGFGFEGPARGCGDGATTPRIGRGRRGSRTGTLADRRPGATLRRI